MDGNLIQIYPNSLINPIIPKGDIYSEFLNYNNDTNCMMDNASINSNLEPFDPFFFGKHSRNSSYEDNNLKKNNSLFKSNNNTPNKELKFIFTKNECDNYINGNKNLNINLNNNKINNNINNKIKINNNINIKINEDNKKDKKEKKILFNSFMPTTVTEVQKQKQKIKNKISARKSRLKKKLYVEQLEKEYILVKKELSEIKQKIGMNGDNIISLEETDDIINTKHKNIYDNTINIERLKEEENLIINEKNNEKKNINKINSFTAKQRLILEQLLLNQIEIMMPIKVKIFQNKYLKLLSIDKDDNISVIKNKIKENLKAIEEVYDVNSFKGEDNGGSKIQQYQHDCIKNKSMAHQIYNFYYNLKNYVNEFEKIYFSLI